MALAATFRRAVTGFRLGAPKQIRLALGTRSFASDSESKEGGIDVIPGEPLPELNDQEVVDVMEAWDQYTGGDQDVTLPVLIVGNERPYVESLYRDGTDAFIASTKSLSSFVDAIHSAGGSVARFIENEGYYPEELQQVYSVITTNEPSLDKFENISDDAVREILVGGAENLGEWKKARANVKNVNLTESARDTIERLIEEGQLNLLPAVAESSERIVMALENVVDVTVTSAVELNEDQKKSVEEALIATSTEDVSYQVAYEVDDTVVGGLIIRRGNSEVDLSVATQLQELAGESNE